jgi:hypothetical protein
MIYVRTLQNTYVNSLCGQSKLFNYSRWYLHVSLALKLTNLGALSSESICVFCSIRILNSDYFLNSINQVVFVIEILNVFSEI